MRRIAIGALALLAALALSACEGTPGDNPNTDPRKGRVTLTWSNCATGACIYDWKTCVGPDLLVHIDGDEYWLRGSEECQA